MMCGNRLFPESLSLPGGVRLVCVVVVVVVAMPSTSTAIAATPSYARLCVIRRTQLACLASQACC